MIDSPISTLPSFKAWTLRFLIAICFLVPAVLTSLFADDEIPAPTWHQGVSQWSGSGYELPVNLPAPVLTETPADPLPYTIPVDPTHKTASNRESKWPNADGNATLSLSMPQQSSTATGIHKFTTSPGKASAGSWKPLKDVETKPDTTQDSVHLLPPPASSEPGEGAAESESSDQLPPWLLDKTTTTGISLETAPLESEVVRWYEYPRRWMRGWDSNAELGLNGSDGNADTLAIQTGFELKRKSAMRTLAIDFDYRVASSRNVTVEENGRLNIDCDRFVRGSDWAGFGKFGLEWDRFKAFDLRLNLNGGFGYHWIRRENATLVTRFGAGGSREIGAPDSDWIPEATFGIDAERQLTSRQKLKAKVDYFPALRGFGDFRLVSDIAWEVLLDGSDNLSLKIAASDRYDSTPQGAKPNDVYYSVLLLRKF